MPALCVAKRRGFLFAVLTARWRALLPWAALLAAHATQYKSFGYGVRGAGVGF